MTDVEVSYNRGISSGSSYLTSTPSHLLRHTDDSFEVITDDFSMIHNSLSPATSLRSSFIVPLQNVIVQNKELKKLLEKCTKKVEAVAKDREMMSQQLQMEKNKCATLEEETLRLQVEITSLHQRLDEAQKEKDEVEEKLTEAQKEKDEVEEKLTESTKLVAPVNQIGESSQERIKINAMRQSKMESLAKRLSIKTKELEEYKKHLKSKDDALVTAHKNNESMRSRLMILEGTLSQEKEHKSGSDSKCNSMQLSVAQLNVRLTEEATTYTKEIEHLHGKHADELTTVRAESNQKVENLQKQINALAKEVRTKEREKQELCGGLEDAHKKEIEEFNKANKRLSSEVAGLKVKLQEKETVLSQLDRERKSLADTIEHLRHQVHSYDTDFVAERQSREQLIVDNQKLKQQLKEREEQFSKFNDDFTTNKFAQDRLTTDNNQLQQQIDKLTNECEQLRRSQQQKDDRLTQLSNQISTELQIKEHVLAENQTLKDKLELKESEIYRLNTDLDTERQQHRMEADRFRERIHTLEQTVDAQQKDLLQLGGHHTNTPLAGQTPNANLYTPPPQLPFPGQYKEQPTAIPHVDHSGPLHSPSFQQECPLCGRRDFHSLQGLQEHAAICST